MKPSDESDRSDRSAPYRVSTASGAIAANTLICLINQATYLLGRQIQRLEKDFLEKGGITERMYQQRVKARGPAEAPSTPASPCCPRCGEPMVQRVARRGSHKGKPFWGCSKYPDCTGIRSIDQGTTSDKSDGSDRSD